MRNKFVSWIRGAALCLFAVIMALPSAGAQTVDLNALDSDALARLYSSTENDLNRARQSAVGAGAQVLAPDFLLDADNTVVLALQKYEAQDFNGAKGSADDALLMYNTLRQGLDIYNLRENFAWQLAVLAPEVLWQADDAAFAAIAKWDAKDYSGAKTGADSALFLYETLEGGLAAYDARQRVAWRLELLEPEALWQADDIAINTLDEWFYENYTAARAGVEKARFVYGVLGTGLAAYEVRENVAVRVDALAPEVLWQADDIALQAIDKYYSENYDAAKDGAEMALFAYNTLGDGLLAFDTRENIALAVFAIVPEALWQADDVAFEAIDEWLDAQYSAARAGTEMALFVYDALGTGLAAYDTRESIALDLLALEPEALWQADDVAMLAVDRWLYENYYGAKVGADRALFLYDTLQLGLEAYYLREAIAGAAVTIDPNAIWRADDIGWEAIDRWYAADYEGARLYAEAAMLGYTATGVVLERQKALEARADTADRHDFNTAQALYALANAALQEQRYGEASSLFRESMAMFNLAAHTATARRLNAEEALRRAELRVLESEQTARLAETILQGGR